MSTRIRRFNVLTIAILALVGFVGLAQASTPDVDNLVELLRSDLKADKVAIIGEALGLGEKKAEAFWPVYREYQAELDKIGDRQVANLKSFLTNFDGMTDDKARELASNGLELRKDRLSLLEKYQGRFEKVIGPINTAKLIQVEVVLQQMVDLQIASELPLIKKPGKSAIAK